MINRRLLLTGLLALLAGLVSLALARPTPAAPAGDDLPRLPISGSGAADEFAPGSLLVKFKDGAGEALASASLQALGAEVVETLPVGGIQVLSVPQGAELATAAALEKLAGVEYAEPNYIQHLSYVPNDEFYGEYQWNMPMINAPQAWDRPQGPGPLVGVLDSGLDFGHPDLQGRFGAGSGRVNCGQSTTADDNNGHGTHVAGIIGAASNNGIGVAGVSWTSTILSFKAANAAGSLCTSDWIYGIDWLADRGVRIINMSFGGSTHSQAAQDAVNDAWNRGILLVAASGNQAQNGNPISYPASYDKVISVGAVDEFRERSDFSTYNQYVDIAAPGGGNFGSDVASTYWRGSGDAYYALPGTSMASPHVAGAAALLLTHYPNLTNVQLYNALLNTATDLGTPGRDSEYGHGLLNVLAALNSVAPAPPPTPTIGPGCLFSDVCPPDFFFTPVQYLVNRGAISGYNDNTFRPFGNATRGQLTKILVVGQGWTLLDPVFATFQDVDTDNPFYTYVETAYDKGVISGYGCGAGCLQFRWGNNVTRGQLARIIVLAEGWTLLNPATPTFVDVPRTNPFYKEIETAVAKGIISGYNLPNGQREFRWAANATRGQISKIIHSALTAP